MQGRAARALPAAHLSHNLCNPPHPQPTLPPLSLLTQAECVENGAVVAREAEEAAAAAAEAYFACETSLNDTQVRAAKEKGGALACHAWRAGCLPASLSASLSLSLLDPLPLCPPPKPRPPQSALDDCSVAAGVLRSEAEGLSAEREGLAGDKARCLEAKAVVEEELEGERQENEGLQGVAEDLEECLAALGNATAAAAPAAPVGPVVGR